MYSKRLLFVLVILFTIFIRFWNLGLIPAGFHVDEASFGYNAYSLMKTGRDEYGVFMPIVTRGFNDYRSTVYAYMIIPFIKLAGLNAWSVRAPTAVFGILFVLLTYGFTYQLSKNKLLAFISMILAAVSPLGILLSRVQSDPLVCFVIFYAAIYCWFLWVEKHNVWYLALSIFGTVVSIYTYAGIRVFAPPFMLLVGVWFWRTLTKRVRVISTAFFMLVFVVIAGLYFAPTGTRFSQISVFSTMNVQLPLNEEIREDQHLPMIVTRVLHNKVTAYGRFILKNFTDYLSFQFLFMQADQPQREQIPNMGVLLLIECPFLLIGIYTAIRKKLGYGLFALSWFLLVPTVMSFASEETPNIHRFFLAMFPIHLLVALGILTVARSIKRVNRPIIILGIIVVFTVNEFYFLHELFIHQPMHTSLYRNEPDQELAMYLKSSASSYDVIVSQKILEDMLFFWPIDPATYQKEGSPRDTDDAWFRNFFFVANACPSLLGNSKVASLPQNRILYVDRAECQVANNDRIIHTIKYKNTLNAYYLVVKK